MPGFGKAGISFLTCIRLSFALIVQGLAKKYRSEARMIFSANFPDFAKMDIPENLGETLIEALSNSGIPETDAIGTSVEETTGLQASPVLKQFKQEDMENKDLLKGMENASAYREMFLTRKMTGARRQTYIDESLYETLTGILPVIAPGISVPTFVNNVLAEHMEKYRDIIDETCHRKFKEMMVWKDSSICR